MSFSIPVSIETIRLFFSVGKRTNTLDKDWAYQTASKPKTQEIQQSIEGKRGKRIKARNSFCGSIHRNSFKRKKNTTKPIRVFTIMGTCQSSEPAAAQKRSTTKTTSLNLTNVFREESAGPECAIDDGIKAADSTISCSQKSTTREKMKLWKEELEASGNLTKTVVHIEVSITE